MRLLIGAYIAPSSNHCVLLAVTTSPPLGEYNGSMRGGGGDTLINTLQL